MGGFRPFKWVDWWMSYLNYQIEHHLFPSMPQFNHPIISPRVKALFEKHDVRQLRHPSLGRVLHVPQRHATLHSPAVCHVLCVVPVPVRC